MKKEVFMNKRLLLALCASSAFAASAAQAETTSPTGDLRAVVSAVIDGDTIELEQSGIPLQVDLESIDAPELAQPYGSNAKAVLESLVLNKKVSIVLTRSVGYQHIRGVVYQDGKNINQLMVAKGAAWFDKSYAFDSTFQNDQSYAQKHKLGLWSQHKPQNPDAYRMGPNRIVPKTTVDVSYPTQMPVEATAPAPVAPGNGPVMIQPPPPSIKKAPLPAPAPARAPVHLNDQKDVQTPATAKTVQNKAIQ
ncbi:thermonuclease family protein [Pseudomonas luteola]